MHDRTLNQILRAALALSIASPAATFVSACSEGEGPDGSGTSDLSAASTGGGDAAPEGARACAEAALPEPSPYCTKYRQLPCGYTEDMVPATGDGCRALCADATDPTDVPANFCEVYADERGTRYLGCYSCRGRKPDGLVEADPARGTALGAFFADVSHLEAASVEAFLTLGAELEAHGAPHALVERSTRAAGDEVRHAKITAALARRFGALQGNWSEAPRVRQREERSLADLAVENVVEGCVAETFGALVGLYQAEYAKNERIRAAMTAIAEDETRHAALAWSVFSWTHERLDEPARLRVRRAMTDAVAKLAAEARLAPDPLLVEHAGVPDAEAATRLVEALTLLLFQPESASA